MRTDEQLRERFDRAVGGLSTPPGDVARVAARARQRARRQRAAGAVAGVAVVLAAVVIVPQVVSPTERVTVDPVETSTAPAPADPTPTSVAEAVHPVGQDHVRYGVEGVVAHRAEGPTLLSSQSTKRAIGLADGGAVVQLGSGGPIDRIHADGRLAAAVSVTTPGGPRLLAVHDGHIWFTVREATFGGEDEEHLLSVPIDGGEPTDHGVSAGVESFTDALAFLPDGRAVWLSCHLQCTVMLGESLPSEAGEADPVTEPAGWYAGLAVSPAGDRLAVVDGPDPVLGGRSDVVVFALDGTELERAPLPVGLAPDVAQVEFTADGGSVVAGDDRHGFVVSFASSRGGRVAQLEGDAGVALLPAATPSPDEAADVARDLTERGLGWTGATVGEPRVDQGRTWVPVGVVDDRAPTEVLVEELAGEVTVTGGGDLAADHEDTSGWWFGVSAEDGHLTLAGHTPTWAAGGVRASVWSPGGDGAPAVTADRGDDGSFVVELDAPAQATEDVVVLLTTWEADVATSFALVRVPRGTLAAS